MALFHSILTATDTVQQSGSKAPLILAGVLGALLLIAFCIGLKKGARRISWTGLVWLVAGVAFLLLHKYVSATLNTALASVAQFLPEASRQYAGTLALAVGAVVDTLVLYGVFTLIFRPREKRRKKKFDKYDDDDFDDEYDDEETMFRKDYDKPSIVGRLLGGLLCAVNVGMILAVTVGTALLLLNGTGLKTHWAGLFGNATVQKAIGYANQYALDLLLIGILVAFACKGNKKGFLETLRGLLMNLGIIAVLIYAFYLPFGATATGVAPVGVKGAVFRLVYRCEVAVASIGESAVSVAPIASKIVAGLLLAILFVAATLLINWLLKLAIKGVHKVGVLQAVNGSIASVIYLVVGAAVCVAIWMLFAVLAYYEIFNIANFFTDGATLSNAFLKACQGYIHPILDAFPATGA